MEGLGEEDGHTKGNIKDSKRVKMYLISERGQLKKGDICGEKRQGSDKGLFSFQEVQIHWVEWSEGALSTVYTKG